MVERRVEGCSKVDEADEFFVTYTVFSPCVRIFLLTGWLPGPRALCIYNLSLRSKCPIP